MTVLVALARLSAALMIDASEWHGYPQLVVFVNGALPALPR